MVTTTAIHKTKIAQSYVQVIVEYNINRTLVYSIPEGVCVEVGYLIKVPIKTSTCLAIVISYVDPIDISYDVLDIVNVLSTDRLLSQDTIKLMMWMNKFYNASWMQLFNLVVPSILRTGTTKGRISQVIKKCCNRSVITSWIRDHRYDLPALCNILESIGDSTCETVSTIRSKTGATKKELSQLIQYGLIKTIDVCSANDLIVKHDLLSNIQSTSDISNPKSGLIWEGFSSDDLSTISNTLSNGQTCIVLVPQITKANRLIGTLRAHFPHITTLLHSGLSTHERKLSFKNISSGRTKIVIGTRSAIFAPMQSLGLIIVYDEHNWSYRSERSPNFHIRDVALERATICNATILFKSACPSMEIISMGLNSYNGSTNTKSINYQFVKPPENGLIISNQVIELLRTKINKKEQAIVFINKKGFYASSICKSCNCKVSCKTCSVPFIAYKKQLKCYICKAHHCINQIRCEQCYGQVIYFTGYGTLRIHEIISKCIPNAKCSVLDADIDEKSTTYINSLFKTGKLDIIIGTQAICKLSPSPFLSTAIVINPEQHLFHPDFRSYEKLLQSIEEIRSLVYNCKFTTPSIIFQSRHIDDDTYKKSLMGNYKDFASVELDARYKFKLPPFYRIAKFLIRHENESKAKLASESLYRQLLLRLSSDDLVSYPSMVDSDQTHHCYIILVKSKFKQSVAGILSDAMHNCTVQKDMIKLEFDPVVID